MLPPLFLILPQAEINFNYFLSLAHYECQDNEAVTLRKYVAPGMCLLERRRRGACAWRGLGCWAASGVHHRRASFRCARVTGCFPCRTTGYSAWNISEEIHTITCWKAARSAHGYLEMKGLGFKGRRATGVWAESQLGWPSACWCQGQIGKALDASWATFWPYLQWRNCKSIKISYQVWPLVF